MATHEAKLLGATMTTMIQRKLQERGRGAWRGKSTGIDHKCRRKMVQGYHLGKIA
jgi:hypothetical protein